MSTEDGKVDGWFEARDATPLASAVGSAKWDYHPSNGVNIWRWTPATGTAYMVTQHKDNIQSHLTTGTAHKLTRTLGAWATVKEAKTRCQEHWQNEKLTPLPLAVTVERKESERT